MVFLLLLGGFFVDAAIALLYSENSLSLAYNKIGRTPMGLYGHNPGVIEKDFGEVSDVRIYSHCSCLDDIYLFMGARYAPF